MVNALPPVQLLVAKPSAVHRLSETSTESPSGGEKKELRQRLSSRSADRTGITNDDSVDSAMVNVNTTRNFALNVSGANRGTRILRVMYLAAPHKARCHFNTAPWQHPQWHGV